MFDRGWTDGLPVVPPTEERVLRMLEGTTRAARRDRRHRCRPTSSTSRSRRSPSTRSWPAAGPSTCRVVLAAVEAACTDEFNIHGVLATTMPVGPVIDRATGPVTPRASA